jgi:hypothetical protein
MVNGVGGRMGPDLSDIGAKRSPANLRTSILDANASIVPGWAVARVTLAGGGAASGVKINEDQFSVMIREGNGKIHHIAKADASRIDVDSSNSRCFRLTGVCGVARPSSHSSTNVGDRSQKTS